MFDTVAGKAVLLGNQLYGPYGNKRYQAGTISTSKGYTGQREDAATGLDYYNARYYDPVVGRFVSADIKEGNAQGLDPYAYVQGNPETLSDPSGYSGMVSGGFQHRPPSGGVTGGFEHSSGGGGMTGGFEHSSGGGGSVPVPTPASVPKSSFSQQTHSFSQTANTSNCDDDCGYVDKVLIKDKINQEKAMILARIEVVNDVAALLAELVVLGSDAIAGNTVLTVTDLLIVMTRVLTLVADVAKANGKSIPSAISSIVTYTKTVLGFIDTIRGFLAFLNPEEGWLKGAVDWLGTKVKNQVIVWAVAGVGVSSFATGVTKQGVEDSYKAKLDAVSALTNGEAHTQCLQMYAARPNVC
jgi:RHS repeat-associated protein